MNDAVMFRRIRRPMHLHAIGQRLALEFQEIFIEMGQCVILDL